MFSFMGTEIVTIAAAESKDPSKATEMRAALVQDVEQAAPAKVDMIGAILSP